MVYKETRHFTKRALRIINKKGYRSHTDPLYKSAKILKIVDLFKLQASLFMYDLEHDLLPKSFRNFVMKQSFDTDKRITRQDNSSFLFMRNPELTFL